MMSLRWTLNWLLGNEKLLKQYQIETPFFFFKECNGFYLPKSNFSFFFKAYKGQERYLYIKKLLLIWFCFSWRARIKKLGWRR